VGVRARPLGRATARAHAAVEGRLGDGRRGRAVRVVRGGRTAHPSGLLGHLSRGTVDVRGAAVRAEGVEAVGSQPRMQITRMSMHSTESTRCSLEVTMASGEVRWYRDVPEGPVQAGGGPHYIDLLEYLEANHEWTAEEPR